MKIFKVFIVLTFIGGLLFLVRDFALALDPYRSLCVGIQGRFNADSSWKGGSIQVGCAGDDGSSVPKQAQVCTGEVQTVRPGQLFRLTKCSCFGSDKGCMKSAKELRLEPLVDGIRKITVVKRIDEIPAFISNSCSVNRTGDICGSNGQHIIGNIKITCNVLANSNTSISITPIPSGVTPTTCPIPEKVTNVKITCPNCIDANSSSAPTPPGQPTN
jgi:hypothetical protein